LVLCQRIEMLPAIQLDYQPRRHAYEVHDVTGQRIMPPEFIASQLPPPQEVPQATLGIGAVVAQPSCIDPHARQGESFVDCERKSFTPSQPPLASRGRSTTSYSIPACKVRSSAPSPPCSQGRAQRPKGVLQVGQLSWSSVHQSSHQPAYTPATHPGTNRRSVKLPLPRRIRRSPLPIGDVS
jgi:hypothetical protein